MNEKHFSIETINLFPKNFSICKSIEIFKNRINQRKNFFLLILERRKKGWKALLDAGFLLKHLAQCFDIENKECSFNDVTTSFVRFIN